MQSIKTHDIGATDNKPSRVKATASGGRSITVSWDYDLDYQQNHIAACKALCERLQWSEEWAIGGTKNGFIFVAITETIRTCGAPSVFELPSRTVCRNTFNHSKGE